MARRSYGSGSLFIPKDSDQWYGKFWANGRQVKRRIGQVRSPHKPDGLTKTMAEARLRELMAETIAAAPQEHARTLNAAHAAWIAHLEATGTKASTVRAYKAALGRWFLPSLGDRSLDRITTSDVEHAMRQMRKAELSDKTIRNYVGALRALYTYAMDRRRRWATRSPVADIELPKLPTYTEIRYLTPDEVWLLVERAQPGAHHDVDRAMYLTAGMTGLRIGELQALEWASVDFAHSRVRVRRTWDRKTKEFTSPKSKRSERAIPMADAVAGELDRLSKTALGPLVFADPATGEPMGHRAMYERLRKALVAAGLDERHGFHTLRHSFGTACAAQGVPMRVLQEWMGHRDIQTTQRYADYSPNPHERTIVEAAFARSPERTSVRT